MKPSVIGRREPKPCPRCYAPMRPTATGFECERHGAPPQERTRAKRPERAASSPRPRAKRARPSHPREASQQTQRLREIRETIIARNQAGESIAAIAGELWAELGYTDRHVCASKIHRYLRLCDVSTAEVRSGPPPGTRAQTRFTEERLAEVRAALAGGSNVWAFAGQVWEPWGFASRSSCDSLIRKWLRTRPVLV